MAAVVVEDNATRVETFEGAPTITGINVGGSGAKELVTFYQGAASASAKATSGTKDAGFWVTSAATHDVTVATGNPVWMVKFFISDGSDLDADGMKLRAGDTTANYYETYVYNTPTLTAVDEWAITGQWTTGGAKSENVFLDSIDLSEGLWLTRGDSTDPDGTFEDFYNDDEGDTATTTGRYGHVSKPNELDGVYQCFGTLVIGRTQAGSTANATVFTDSAKTLVFPGGRVTNDWNTLELDITNASTVITIDNCTFSAAGYSGLHQRFRTAAGTVGTAPGIDVTPDEIEFDTGATGLVPHGFVTGQPLLYSKEGGTATTGLTDATVYYAVEGTTSTRLGLATNRVNAFAGTLIALTATAGEEHSLTGEGALVTRCRLLCTNGGTPGSAGINASSFVGWDEFVVTTGITFTGCNFIGARLIDLDTATNNGGTLDGCTLLEMINDVGDALVVADTLANISDCDFTHYVQGGDADGTFNRSGHAIEINTAGTYAFVGNTFTDYGPIVQSFLTSQAFTSNQINITGHPYTTGDPVYYHKDGGTAAIGLTDGNLYYVRSVDANNITLHPSWADATENANTEALTTNGTDTHLLYSGFAAIVNTSNGSVTINVSGGGTSPSIRNVGTSTTTVVLNPVTTLVTVRDNDGVVLQDARVYLKAADGTGPLPYQDSVTASRDAGTTVTVTHTSHGMETNDKVSIKGITNATEDNNGVRSITVTDANTYTFTSSGSGTLTYTGTITSTWVCIEELTNASGNASRTKSYASNQPVDGWIRKSTTSPRFKSFPVSGTINSADGLTINVQMILDE
jgi:hypothetical protein